MNILDVDKKGKFSLSFTSDSEYILHALPTCRYRPGKTLMSLQPLVEVWRSLRPLVDRGVITPTDSARDVLCHLGSSYTTHRRNIRSAERRFKGKYLDHIPVPLKSIPYEHQTRAFGFASSLEACALLMEQGTGKTLVALALLGHRYSQGSVKKVVVVCPKSVIPVWPNELRKHADFEYSWDQVPKSPKAKIRDTFGPGLQILVVNYDKLKSREKDIKKWNPDMMVLDESHRIKKKSSNRSKVCHRMGDRVEYKLILTGTPLGQSLVDAWSQYRFLNSNIFGRSFADFRDSYCRMGGYMGKQIMGYKDIPGFANKLHSIAFRCTKSECLDLPPTTSQNVYCESDAETRRIYREMDRDLFTKIDGGEVEVELQVSKLMKLRQITGGMVKGGEDRLLPVSRKKLSCLQEIIENKDWTRKLAIFASFTHEIKMIQELCEGMGKGCLVLSGATPDQDRFNLEERFRNDKSCPIVLIQVDTGGEGLDFTPADMGVFYSPTFSYIKYDQIKARIHRIGQDHKVTYINIIMEGTVDEDIIEFLEEHGDLTTQVLEKSRNYHLEIDNMNRKKLEQALDEIEAEIQEDGLSNPNDEEDLMSNDKKKPAKAKAQKPSKAPAKKPAKADDAAATPQVKTADGYTAAQFAEEFDIDTADLRKYLRAIKAEKPGKSWVWPKKTDAGLKEIRTELKAYIKGLSQKEAKASKKGKPEKAEKGGKEETSPKKSKKKKSAK